MDQLSQIISTFTIKAGVFYTGQLCGISAFENQSVIEGHIHILKAGSLTVKQQGASDIVLTEPGVVFFPRPKSHRISANESDSAEVICATVRYSIGNENPIAQALPDVLILPFSKMPQLSDSLRWMINESLMEEQGKHAIMDRLMEVLIISLLRFLINENQLSTGLLAALAHPQLSKVVLKVHAQPEKAWTVDDMAQVSLMSRSKFSPLFKEVLGRTPLDYLTRWRVNVAQQMLLTGKPVNIVANEVGYETTSALSRAFQKTCQLSPKAWLSSITL